MVKIIRDCQGFNAIKGGWDDFASRIDSPAAVFMSHGWLSAWIKYFLDGKRGKKPFIAVDYDDKAGGTHGTRAIRAAAPLYKERFFIFFRSLRFISDDYSDYRDILTGQGACFTGMAGMSGIARELEKRLNAGLCSADRLDIIFLKQVSGAFKDAISGDVCGRGGKGAGIASSPAHLRLRKKQRFLHACSQRYLAMTGGLGGAGAERGKIRFKSKPSGSCYYIDLNKYGSMEGYLEKFNSKQRYNILKRVKDAGKEGVEYVTVPQGSAAAGAGGGAERDGAASQADGHRAETAYVDYIGEFFNLHQKRWRGKGGKGVFHSAAIRDFFRSLFGVLDEKGFLNLSFLKFEGKFIAGAVCFDAGGRRQVYLPGFDPEYSYLHPGIVLTYYNIEEAFAAGRSEFDFLKGPEDYKKRFLAEKRENYKIYIYRNRAAYALFKLNIFLKNEISSAELRFASKIYETFIGFRA